MQKAGLYAILMLVSALSCGLDARANGATESFTETRSFWVWDLTVMPPGFRQPAFNEAAVVPLSRDRLHLWVENGLGEHAPDPAALAKLLPLYARSIELERPIFGDQPVSPSGDRDIHLVLAAIPPYEKHGKKFGFDGFFNVFDQLTEARALEQGQHSNERDIIYVNALQDVTSDYMVAVVTHELNHLLTSARFDSETNPLDPWLNELLAESAMQLAGYYTDVHHVESYRAAPEQPLAVEAYGISYGGISLFAEYLMTLEPAERLGRVAPEQGDAFARLSKVYGRSWNALFEGYVGWLFSGRSSFAGEPVAPRAPSATMNVGPTGVLYLPAGFDARRLRIASTPKGCSASKNELRAADVSRAGLAARAIWIESMPPCAVSRGGADSFEGFALTQEGI